MNGDSCVSGSRPPTMPGGNTSGNRSRSHSPHSDSTSLRRRRDVRAVRGNDEHAGDGVGRESWLIGWMMTHGTLRSRYCGDPATGMRGPSTSQTPDLTGTAVT